MSDIICVTNRRLCRDDFLHRIEQIAASHPAGILLREKDLSEYAYKELAADVLRICRCLGTPCILHSFPRAALELGSTSLHLPLPILRSLTADERAHFSVLGASCHSIEDAVEAENFGCTYITAGHIFATDCKKGLPGRGLEFLQQICSRVSIPVYAIGGISPENAGAVRLAGAHGFCVMSGIMMCEDPQAYLSAFTPTPSCQ